MGQTQSVKREVAYPNGNHYYGDMKGKKRHGQGTYTWGDDGTIYTGGWVNNEMSGHGETTFKNGNKYIGSFFRNNIDGRGRMETLNREVIEGVWTFKMRANNVPNSWNEPVAKYDLNVVVTSSEGLQRDYRGPASLQLKTGLVVLPYMNDPNESVYAAIVVSDADGKNESLAVVKTEEVNAQHVQQSDGSIDFGGEDINRRPQPKPVPMNPLNPRNYF